MFRAIAATDEWLRLMFILMCENFSGRYRSSKAGGIFAIFEPFGVIGVMAASHYFLAAPPPFGNSNTLFYATGILPFYLFYHVTLRARTLDHMRPVPHTNLVDMLLANVIDEIITKAAIMTLAFGSLYIYGVKEAIPADPLQALLGLMALVLCGVAFGVFNAFIGTFFHGWHFIFAIVIRSMMPFSGIMQVMDKMPPGLRDFAAWMPISHGVVWFRSGYYQGFPHHALSKSYLVFASLVILSVGVLLFDATKKWRS